MSPAVEIPWPRRGQYDSEPEGKQPPATTQRAVNVRNIDPVTGRATGAQRAGLAPAVEGDPVLGPGAVQRIASVTWTQRPYRLEPYVTGDTTEKWEQSTESGLPVRRLARDLSGNVYAADGSSKITKANAEGDILETISLPSTVTGAGCREVLVDSFGNVYFGTTDIADPEEARVWRFQPDEGAGFVQGWELDLGGPLVRLRWQGGILYAAWNDAASYRSYVTPIVAPESAAPTTLKPFEIPYPASDFDLQSDGTLVACAPPFSGRRTHPKAPTGPTVDAWSIKTQLPDFADRIWAEWSAEHASTGLEPGDFVTALSDIHGTARAYVAPSGSTGPTLVEHGLGGLPALRFKGATQSLAGVPAPLADAGTRQSNDCPLPVFREGAYALFLVVQIKRDDAQFPIFGWGDDTAVVANRGNNSGTLGLLAGAVHVDAGCTDGAGPGGRPAPDPHAAANQYQSVLVTLLHNEVRSSSTGAAEHRLTVRINGKPIDRATSLEQWVNVSTSGGVSRLTKSSGYTFTSPTLGGAPDHQNIGSFTPGSQDWQFSHGLVLQRRDYSTYTGDPGNVINDREVLDHPVYPDVPYNAASDTELEQIEGWLAHRYGIQVTLPQTPPAGSAFGHPYKAAAPYDADLPVDPNGLRSVNGIAVRYDGSTGKLSGLIEKAGGIGDSIRVVTIPRDPEDETSKDVEYVASAGPPINQPPTLVDPNGLRRLSDSFTLTGANAWGDGLGLYTLRDHYQPQLEGDDHGNVYWPIREPLNFNSQSIEPGAVRVYDSTGSLLVKHDRQLLAKREGCYAALPEPSPAYDPDDDFTTEARLRASRVLLGLRGVTNDQARSGLPTLALVELVEKVALTRPTRSVYHIAVAGGDVSRFTSEGTVAIQDGPGALSAASRFVSAASLFQEVFLADGASIKVYQPRLDRVVDYAPTKGSLPEELPEILVSWSGRLVGARLAGNPHQFWLSAQGDPYDLDFAPTVTNAQQAVFSATGAVGDAPDIITALVPWTDDVLIVGCDHEIYKLEGNPADGGFFSRLSTVTGMSFGLPWCRTPDGAVVFFGTPFGSVYILGTEGPPRRVSTYTIEQQLRSVNLSTHRVEMAWDMREEGVRIVVAPLGPQTPESRGFLWDVKYDAWWPDIIGPAGNELGIRPTCIAVLDADDPEDRRVVVGCHDGRVRWFDPAARDDAGRLISSSCLIGPLASSRTEVEQRLKHLDVVLTRGSDGVGYRVYASPTADAPGFYKHEGLLRGGRNHRVRPRARGSYLWVELFSTTPGERWALHELHAMLAPAGAKRVRP